jgi:RNA polymerase sigma-70 factor (ECF subfamily)
MNAPTSDEQDTQDMARLAGSHDAALNELMDRHAGKLFHYLVRSLQNEADAADLAQETFVRVYQNRTKFDPSQKFTTWLYAIASNLVRDRYRWRLRHPQASLEAENEQAGTHLNDRLPSRERAPDEHLQIEEQAVVVREAVGALPEELRQPLILAVYEELPQVEIARILKCSVKAVETRIYRARRQLRTVLASLVRTGLP